MSIVCYLVAWLLIVKLSISANIQDRSVPNSERIDCFPEAESKFSSYSKDNCLRRNCLFDDGSPSGAIQCYLRPNYGYVLRASPQETQNGIRLRLQRNQLVGSMFADPINNVVLDVQYYTNDIIRFKLYDEDKQRYEVKIAFINLSSTFCFNLRYQFR